MNGIPKILKEVLEKINPPEKDLKFISNSLKNFLKKFEKEIKKQKIKAEVFIGGSFAKGTMIKKDVYDIDIFVRFDRIYNKANVDISNLLQKIIKSLKINFIKIHGSRDYFRIQQRKDFFIELIPVLKISSPKEAENITDLSYSHVKYIKRKIKNEKLKNEIKIAKAFCHANRVYGAESYINGFSGYGLELLIYYYKGFLRFIKAMSKINIKEKTIIDIERHYPNKNRVLIDMNASKLSSPIILVDPTYKQRNALAALSYETFKKFQTLCKKFLKKPSIKFFEEKKLNLKELKNYARKYSLEMLILKARTNKQEGDIAGSKLLKFFKHLEKEILKYFEIKKKEFNYNGKKSAEYYFIVKSKKYIISQGPFLNDKESVKTFKKAHKKSKFFVKKNKIYAKDKINFTIKDFLKSWKKNNKKRMKEMSIIELKIIN